MKKEKKKCYSFSNIFTAILVIFIIIMIINPTVKSTVIQGLMKIGLFQPKVAEENTTLTSQGEHDYSLNFLSANGNIIQGETLKNKVVFINFWATWCPPCIAEMPSINELYQDHRNNPEIVFLMIDADSQLQQSQDFMLKKKFDLPVVAAKGNIPDNWYNGTLPTTIVLDKKGNVVYRQTGAAAYTNKKFKNFILNLISQK